jgi:quercetin dioxygenase-like cupin family protein
MTRMTQCLLTLTLSSCWLGGMFIAASAQQPPPQSKGQKVVELCSLDLTAEIDSGAGRRLRVRLITLEPGGVVAVHGHQDRPTIMHVLEGYVISHVVDKADSIRILRDGDCVAEGKDITHHWMENAGTKTVRYIAVDVAK